MRDQVLSFQLKNQFEPLGVLENYLPEDRQSDGHAAHLVWRNPYVDPDEAPEMRVPRGVESVRPATCQLQARAVKDFDEFIRNIEYFVDVAADYRSDFIIFPELFTLPLLSFETKKLSPMEAIDKLTNYTPRLTKELTRMALNIISISSAAPTRPAPTMAISEHRLCRAARWLRSHARENPPHPNEASGGTSRAAICST